MKTNYFTVELSPTIAASKQHAGTFGSGSCLFNWQAIQIPRGTCALVSATALVRAKGDADPTPNHVSIDLFFAKSNAIDLGTQRSQCDHRPNNNFIGYHQIEGGSSYAGGGISATSVATSSAKEGRSAGLVLQPALNSDSSTGLDTIYVAAACAETTDFQSINAIAEDTDAEHADSKVITMDGSSMDVREHFAPGDIVHIGTSVGTPAADSLIGTIATADSATQVTLNAVSPTALVDGDILYNINPVKLILGFEK